MATTDLIDRVPYTDVPDKLRALVAAIESDGDRPSHALGRLLWAVSRLKDELDADDEVWDTVAAVLILREDLAVERGEVREAAL